MSIIKIHSIAGVLRQWLKALAPSVIWLLLLIAALGAGWVGRQYRSYCRIADILHVGLCPDCLNGNCSERWGENYHNLTVQQQELAKVSSDHGWYCLWKYYDDQRGLAYYLCCRYEDYDAEKLIQLGLEAEPDNAFYDIAKTVRLIKESTRPGSLASKYAYDVTDPVKFRQAMNAYLTALKKPYFETYARELMQDRFDQWGSAESRFQVVLRCAISCGILLPELNGMRACARALPIWAETLIAQNRQAEAEQLLDTWYKFLSWQAERSWSLIDIFVDVANAELYRTYLPALYQELERPEKAEQLQRALEQFVAPFKSWRRDRGKAREMAKNNDWLIYQYGYFPATMTYLSNAEWNTPDDFYYGRAVEYAEMNREILVSALFALILISVSLFIGGFWRIRLPDCWRFVASPGKCLILTLVCLAPALLVMLITAFPALAGLNRNPHLLHNQYMALSACLFLMLTILPVFTAAYLAGQDHEQGCKTSSRSTYWLAVIAIIIAGTTLIPPWIRANYFEPTPKLIIYGTPVIITIILVAIALFPFKLNKNDAIVRGKIIFAMSIAAIMTAIFIGLAGIPFLHHIEKKMLQNDPIIIVWKKVALSGPEMRMVNRFKFNMVQTLKEFKQ